MKTDQQTRRARTAKIAASDAIATLVLGAAMVIALIVAGVSALLAAF